MQKPIQTDETSCDFFLLKSFDIIAQKRRYLTTFNTRRKS